MLVELDVRPPYSIVFIGTPDCELPSEIGDQGVASTPDCVVIGTRAADHASTRIVIAESATETTDLECRLEATLDVPEGVLRLFDAHDQTLWSGSVDTTVRIQVWTDDPVEPDRILIVTAS